MQALNITTLSNDELHKIASMIPKLKRVSFQHVKKVLKQIDDNYPFILIGY